VLVVCCPLSVGLDRGGQTSEIRRQTTEMFDFGFQISECGF
jgi:hypothetical protein